MYKAALFVLAFFISGFFGLVIGMLIILACHENGVYLGNAGAFGLVSLVLVFGSVGGLVVASRVKDPLADDAVVADYDDRPRNDRGPIAG
ncbi:MAG TPA: hypothetical protein VM597_10245 [Gemmataceae bacterium]|jgi:hypothetical protein|nr:hypothetical protein [Gemmataceae bacterium]